MGPVIFSALAIYLIVLITVPLLAARWAAKRGLSTRKRWLAAFIGFLVVYLPVFWDHIPTLVAHKYYCEKEAGFWVYKTMEQWRAENPGVKKPLVRNKMPPSSYEGDQTNFTSTHFWNQHFSSVLKKQGPLLRNVWRWEHQVVDMKTGQLLVRRVDFSTGLDGQVGGEPEMKLWLHSNGCDGYEARAKKFADLAAQFKGTEK